jgi:hypothetical protein
VDANFYDRKSKYLDQAQNSQCNELEIKALAALKYFSSPLSA